jgi:hypothetical protein
MAWRAATLTHGASCCKGNDPSAGSPFDTERLRAQMQLFNAARRDFFLFFHFDDSIL